MPNMFSECFFGSRSVRPEPIEEINQSHKIFVSTETKCGSLKLELEKWRLDLCVGECSAVVVGSVCKALVWVY